MQVKRPQLAQPVRALVLAWPQGMPYSVLRSPAAVPRQFAGASVQAIVSRTTNIMRRLFILLFSLFMLAAGGAVRAEDQVKVVYHMADGIDQATRGLASIRNHLRAAPDTKIVVVALGDGIRFMLKGAVERNGRPFDAAVAALAAQGVEFRVCNNTLTAHNVPQSQLLPEASLVPAGVVEIARLQAREGYAYIRP
jgi:intracellular sulfur oxidation DsrE/DsrF family protein